MSIQFMKTTQVKNFKLNVCLKQFCDDLNELINDGFLLPNGARAHITCAGMNIFHYLEERYETDLSNFS